MAIRFLDEEEEAVRIKALNFRRTSSVKPPISNLTPIEQSQEAQLSVEREESPIASALFPRLKEAQVGKRKSEEVSTALDLLSLPGRAITSMLGREDDEGFLESMAQLEEGGFFWNIARDPATGAAILTLPVGMTAGASVKALPKLAQLSALTGIGVAEGLIGAGTTQAEGLTKGEKFGGVQFGAEVAISAVVPAGLQILKGLTRGGGKLAANIAASSMDIDPKTLIKASTKAGRKELKSASGKELALGNEILDVIDDFDEFIPEGRLIDDTLEGMDDISATELMDFIEGLKVEPIRGINLSNAQKKVNKQFDGIIDRIFDLKGAEAKATSTADHMLAVLEASNTYVTANGYKQLRKQISDDVIFDGLGTQRGKLDNGMFKIKAFMKDQLIGKAKEADPGGVKGYASNIEVWSKKLDIKESLDELIGGVGASRQKKASNIMNSVFNKNDKVTQSLIKKTDQLFNNNFIERAEVIRMAGQLGPEGIPRLIPSDKSGAITKTVLGAVAAGPGGAATGFAGSSPGLATKTIGGINLIGDITGSTPTSTLGGLISREKIGREEDVPLVNDFIGE